MNMTNNKKIDLAYNPNTSEDVLRELAKDEDWNVRCSVAQNPSTPLDLLRNLAKDEDWTVREYVAANSNTSSDLLRDLAKDEDWWVREKVASNPKASSKILVMLFEYEKSLRKPSKYVIRSLYTHKNLPLFVKRVIETLFGDML